jgi:GR25 family glycosyltransferase involved in LPS biosynthesis
MKYYCVHHAPLTTRKEILEKRFADLALDVEWCTLFPPQDIVEEPTGIITNKNEISLYKKHRWCLEQQLIHNHSNILVFEDDVLLPDTFNSFLQQCMKEFEELKGDAMFLGTCCNMTPQNTKPTQYVYYSPTYGSRCAHCYVINIKATQRILDFTSIMDEPWDWKLGNSLQKQDMRSCYTEPAIYQATELKIINSTLR